MPQAILERLRSGQSAEVLAEFDVENARRQAHAMATAAGRPSHGPEELAYKRTELARIKAAALEELQGVTTLRQHENLPTSLLRIDTEGALLALLARSGVRAVFENRPLAPFVAETLPFIDQPAVWGAGLGGAGTAVAIIDSGVDYTRNVFGPCSEPPGTPAPGDPGCRVAATFEATLQDDGVLDDFMHGTRVSGIIAEVAPETKLVVADVYRFEVSLPGFVTDAETITAAISWMIGIQSSSLNIVAFDLSSGFGGNFTSPCTPNQLATPFEFAIEAGIQPIVAAGNSGTSSAGVFTDGLNDPACLSLVSPASPLPEPLAVSVGALYDAEIGSQTYSNLPGACTDSTTSADKVACFSQTAEGLSLHAPGVRVTAAGVFEDSGTSFAAPHVAGAWAVMQGAMPNLSRAQTLEALREGGVPVLDHRVPNGRTIPRLEMFVPDLDDDGVPLPLDNCAAVQNALQVDADGDHCGNHCDGDYDDSGVTSIGDFNTFKTCFTRTVGVSGGPAEDPNCVESDMDGSGTMSIADFNLFKNEIDTAPGPSGVPSASAPACQP